MEREIYRKMLFVVSFIWLGMTLCGMALQFLQSVKRAKLIRKVIYNNKTITKQDIERFEEQNEILKLLKKAFVDNGASLFVSAGALCVYVITG